MLTSECLKTFATRFEAEDVNAQLNTGTQNDWKKRCEPLRLKAEVKD
jgi:hypothetical protein